MLMLMQILMLKKQDKTIDLEKHLENDKPSVDVDVKQMLILRTTTIKMQI